MDTASPFHLDSDQLLQAVVSESDLSSDLRDHLKTCTACRQEVDRLRARFGAIGRMARELSPDALGRVRLPERRSRFFLGRRVGLRPALGMAVAMVLLVMLALYQPFGNRWPSSPDPVAETETILVPDAEEGLLAEIRSLLHNPLPDAYQQVTGAMDGGLASGSAGLFGHGDDPMEFIVPAVPLPLPATEADDEFSHTSYLKGTA